MEVTKGEGGLVVGLKRFRAERHFISRIEFSLEYISDLNAKYQISKQVTSRCLFYEHFTCQVVNLTIP